MQYSPSKTDLSKPRQFDHEKLEVYQTSLDFVILVDQTVENLPRGRFYLVDQLHRASSSIALNIAEGAGEYAGNEKARFYRIARRSATECSSIFEICNRLNLINEQQYLKSRELLLRIVAMLTRMTLNLN